LNFETVELVLSLVAGGDFLNNKQGGVRYSKPNSCVVTQHTTSVTFLEKNRIRLLLFGQKQARWSNGCSAVNALGRVDVIGFLEKQSHLRQRNPTAREHIIIRTRRILPS